MQAQGIDLIGRAKMWLMIGGAFVAVSLAGLGVRRLNLGLDFTGGALYQFRFPEKVATSIQEEVRIASQVRASLRQGNLPPAVIQVAEGDTLLIRFRVRNEAEADRYRKTLLKLLQKRFPKIREESTEFIGPVIGRELANAALLGTTFGLIGVSAWIWLRYQVMGVGWLFAFGALLALAHDILVLIGFTAWTRMEVNSYFIAALLTVAGYSVNDTVVIYDRIRENLRVHRGWTLERVVNHSLLEILPRSINTTLTTEFALWAALLLGGIAVKPLAAALIVGITAGTYSSIFIAAPFVVLTQRWWEARQAKRPVARPAPEKPPILRPTLTPSESPQTSPQGTTETPTPPMTPTPTILRPPSPSGTRKKRKKRKRR